MAGQSHKGDGLGTYPRVCILCGGKVKITGDAALQFHCEKGRKWSAHSACLAEHGLSAATAVAVASGESA